MTPLVATCTGHCSRKESIFSGVNIGNKKVFIRSINEEDAGVVVSDEGTETSCEISVVFSGIRYKQSAERETWLDDSTGVVRLGLFLSSTLKSL